MKRLPGEFEPQQSVWLTWPWNPATWTASRDRIFHDHAALVAACSRFQPVDLICPPAEEARCRHHLREAHADLSVITLHLWPVNDAWTRDHGPVFVQTDTGATVVDLPFNAWGGKFPEWSEDDQVARRVSERRNLPCHRFPMFGEGGGLESNGQGTLVVTENVWLNINRNPGATREQLDAAFAEAFGVESVLWLAGGMATDDTDGHIDTLARFVDPHRMVAAFPAEDHPDARQLRENYDRLSEHVEVIELPHPTVEGKPASYANFVLLNDACLVPVYRVGMDEEALGVLREIFPDREVVAVNSDVFLEEGGAVHCLTANEWR